MDELEKHIKSVRDDLDTEVPGAGLWKKIEEDLPGRQRSLSGYLWRAAAAVIVAGAAMAIIAGILRTSEQLNDPQVTEVRETYRYYDNKIKSLYEEAEPLLTANPEISSELTTGMNELDSLSSRIISDLHDNVASREVIEALIYNYRLRIDLLEDMLRLMREHESKTEKMTGNEL
jgi:predicted nuclease with TOPRIM domain